ncbi:hypothetical protein [Legionella brunensis]|uniref:Uncharacterized protein n=1 Tax=Legionella brunensis TaxID=29422 RepID=A0A0W0SL37_9GAMM|nr:hypothetical protein [Legionella brunensis]KTC84135.1 hypothetical protein Lbru_1496 [Legionella brunensis]
MPSFSVFSIYEKEMRSFINKVAESTPLSKDELTTWVYSEGILQFRNGQSSDYYSYVNENVKKFGHRPLISKQHSIGQIFSGFMALQDAFMKYFATDKPDLKDKLEQFFAVYLFGAIQNHIPFITVQSTISSELSAYQDEHGALEPVDALKLSIEIFEKRRLNAPQLEEEFKNQLILMNEFLQSLEQQLKNSKVKTITSGQAFFTVDKEKTLISNEEQVFTLEEPTNQYQ